LFLLERVKLFINPAEFTVVLVAAMGSAGAARNRSLRAVCMFSSKEYWSNCPQRLLMPSAILAVLIVTSRGRVVVIPCEVHAGTPAWNQNDTLHTTIYRLSTSTVPYHPPTTPSHIGFPRICQSFLLTEIPTDNITDLLQYPPGFAQTIVKHLQKFNFLSICCTFIQAEVR
jgi:hypothetical protein